MQPAAVAIDVGGAFYYDDSLLQQAPFTLPGNAAFSSSTRDFLPFHFS
jgi:hypothetical protein